MGKRKYILFFLIGLLVWGSGNSPISTVEAKLKYNHEKYKRSSTYKTYVFKSYEKGKKAKIVTHRYMLKGPYKGMWRINNENLYFEEGSDSTSVYSTAVYKHKTGERIMSSQILPRNLKKGAKGYMGDAAYYDRHKYKVLSTNTTVRTPAKTFKHVLKIWISTPDLSMQSIDYYAKGYGIIKSEDINEGEITKAFELVALKK
ncbi:hypothetical protein AAF454_08040 [Kurthia gibsonii]|uniref:Uncharacterized protein n=1 Tax=Kurthia gibsonii TaxID=33946 RepID=A0ABU9LK08_9BACL